MGNKYMGPIGYSDILDEIRSKALITEIFCGSFTGLFGYMAVNDFANGQYGIGAFKTFFTLLCGVPAVKAELVRRSPERQEKELEFLDEMVESRDNDWRE